MTSNQLHTKTQCSRILAWLTRGKRLTQLQAYNLFGCTRIAARCYDLRQMGYQITGKMIKTRTGKIVKQYSLKITTHA